MQDTKGTAAHPPLSFDELRDVLRVTLRAGQLLLEHGSDAHRVEETMHRMGTALGAVWMDVYVTSTGIIASATNGREHRSNIQRVVGGSIDLSRIDAINHVARRIASEALDCGAVAVELERIAQRPRHYGYWTTVGVVALACGCFSQLFGGNWIELGIAMLGATLALLVRQALMVRGTVLLLQIPVAACIATLGVILLSLLLETKQYDITVPAAVLPLVPGVPLINAFSDLFASDYVSGIARAAQAVLIAAEIAVGVALALDIVRAFGVGV